MEAVRGEIKAMQQYRRHLKREVMAMLAELKQRGSWESESLDPEERERFENPDSLSDVQHIAECLEAIGYK